jgi:hypothetical protein
VRARASATARRGASAADLHEVLDEESSAPKLGLNGEGLHHVKDSFGRHLLDYECQQIGFFAHHVAVFRRRNFDVQQCANMLLQFFEVSTATVLFLNSWMDACALAAGSLAVDD